VIVIAYVNSLQTQ